MRRTRQRLKRDPLQAPVRKLTVNLIHTYKHINHVYYTAKKERLKKKPAVNNGCDDANYNYKIIAGETLAERYQVEQRIGKGSFGQVVRACDKKTQALVAVKIIKSRSAFTKQAQTEINLLKSLNLKDPEDRFYIVRLLDTFVHKNHTCLVFEHLSYNLYDLLRNTSFHGVSLNLIRKFGVQILQALRFLASAEVNVIHCDLKPENILLRHPRRSGIKVIDFGSSCYGDKRMYKYIQSRFYRSPEVILGLKYDVSIDIWSLGCVLVELHTGEPLFNGADEGDQLRRIMELLGPLPQEMMDQSTKISKLEDENPKLRALLQLQAQGKPFAPSNARTLDTIIGVQTGGPGGRRKGEAGHDAASYKVFKDLIQRLLSYSPDATHRLTAADALRHPFFMRMVRRKAKPPSPSSNTSRAADRPSSSEADAMARQKAGSTMIPKTSPLDGLASATGAGRLAAEKAVPLVSGLSQAMAEIAAMDSHRASPSNMALTSPLSSSIGRDEAPPKAASAHTAS